MQDKVVTMVNGSSQGSDDEEISEHEFNENDAEDVNPQVQAESADQANFPNTNSANSGDQPAKSSTIHPWQTVNHGTTLRLPRGEQLGNPNRRPRLKVVAANTERHAQRKLIHAARQGRTPRRGVKS